MYPEINRSGFGEFILGEALSVRQLVPIMAQTVGTEVPNTDPIKGDPGPQRVYF